VPVFDPEFVALMRTVLDDVMLQVPPTAANATTKTLLAEAILVAAAQGRASHDELLAAASEQIQVIVSLLS